MIIDNIENAQNYFNLHPSFKDAFQYIASNDFSTINDAIIEFPNEIKAFITTGQGKLKATSLEKFECHDKYIDIQFCVSGVETFGWKPREKCYLQKGAYNPEKDVRFFNEQPDMFFQLTNNQFAIFFPNDVHAPMIGDSEIKKLVVKIKI
ncbi:YhcH/YjgK/YiaL family protein [Flavobacterium sp.]|uniref:YhcH/YjgK/YiaL family protein n=1 Tax=Flavobacterium sp. TaxID=239 RepID=UPI0024875B15|nr:YhcH/YjgK/YiaL family protein [Flavobacterium sp.]MDI1317041.1 YhcH/YjgK/YiaL family protein [Flavobacterium sp.]